MDIYTLLLCISVTILGFIIGVFVTLSCTIYYALRKFKKKSQVIVQKKIVDTVEYTNKINNIKKELMKVKSITETQLSLQSQIEFPQKNSLDGLHKNRLIKEIKSLEENKVALLKGILNSGFDPDIAILDDNSKQITVKFSEYMAQLGIIADLKVGVAPTIPTPLKNNKFTILKGGKLSEEDAIKVIDNDDDDDDNNKTTH